VGGGVERAWKGEGPLQGPGPVRVHPANTGPPAHAEGGRRVEPRDEASGADPEPDEGGAGGGRKEMVRGVSRASIAFILSIARSYGSYH